MAYTVEDNEEPQSLGNQAMLAKIDKLRELNVSSYVPLPQLVVVGDQSSGKSSVLESLTGFSFPRATTLCTRYATQITCKRSDVKGVHISIMNGPHASQSHKTRLGRFHRRCDKLSDGALEKVFQDANEAMGIRGSVKNVDSDQDGMELPTFSQDILKIEISGPQESHLTVIDVPGIFRTTTEGVTTDHDIAMVKQMVQEYMVNERTIILAVIPCNLDIATQEILKLAKEVDPNGNRTLGVLTKPDLAVEQATKQDVIELVNGNRNSLRLGYYVVKNRGSDDHSSTLKDSSRLERDFFRQDPWRQLEGLGRTGVNFLKKALAELLLDLSRKELPLVKSEIQEKLSNTRSQLEAMGPSRAATGAQRIFLGKLSDRFQKLTQYALDAYYTRDKVFNDRLDLRLVTIMVAHNEKFGKVFAKRGHTRHFASNDDKDDEEDKTGKHDQYGNGGGEFEVFEKSGIYGQFEEADTYCQGDRDDGEKELEDGYHGRLGSSSRSRSYATNSVVGKNKKFRQHDYDFFQVVVEEYPEIKDIIGDSYDCPEPDSGSILTHIEKEMVTGRGCELASIPQTVLATTFKEQTRKWEPLVIGHVSEAICIVHKFIIELLKISCPEDSVRRELWDSIILEELRDCYKRAMKHAHFLLEVEREDPPMTLNHYFTANVEKSKVERMLETIAGGQLGLGGKIKTKIEITIDTIKQAWSEKSNPEHQRDEIHDALKSYYKVSRKRFVDVVCQQVVNHYLLGGKSSPLTVFSNERVNRMTTDQLDMIAGEDSGTRRQRTLLITEMDRLDEAMRVLRG